MILVIRKWLLVRKLRAREEAADYLRGKGEGDRDTLATTLRTALLRIEMVLTRLARHQLPVTGYADSLQI